MSKITRRSYKRKKIVMGLALFGAIGLVSTGFAAWVLSASASKDQGMSIKVGEVDNKSMEVIIDGLYKTSDVVGVEKASAVGSGVSSYNKYSLNPKASDTTGRVRWGQSDEGDEPENMSVTIFGHVTNAQNLQEASAGGLTILLKGEKPANLVTASAAGNYLLEGNPQAREAYIGLPACFESAQNINYALEGDATKTAYFRYDVAFTWGAEFGGENPSEYFDDAGINVPMANVEAMLNDMKTLINAVGTFEVTITAIPN